MALLSCDFQERFLEEEEGEESPAYESQPYPDEQLLKLAVTADIDEREAVCWVEGKLDDERMPFKLSFEMAFLYVIDGDEPIPAVDDLRPTLVWLAFPHLREFIANLTGRSPSAQYFLPPLTRLPRPDGQISKMEAESESSTETAE